MLRWIVREWTAYGCASSWKLRKLTGKHALDIAVLGLLRRQLRYSLVW